MGKSNKKGKGNASTGPTSHSPRTPPKGTDGQQVLSVSQTATGSNGTTSYVNPPKPSSANAQAEADVSDKHVAPEGSERPLQNSTPGQPNGDNISAARGSGKGNGNGNGHANADEDVAQLRKELTASATEVKRLRDTCAELEGELARVLASHDNLGADGLPGKSREEYQEEIRRLEEACAMLERDAEARERERNVYTDEDVRHLEGQVRELQEARSAYVSHIAVLEARADKLGEELERERERVDRSQRDADPWLDGPTTDPAELQEAREKLTIEVEDLQRLRDALEADVFILEDKRRSLDGRHREVQAPSLDSSSQTGADRSEKEELEDLRARCRAMKDELDAMNSSRDEATSAQRRLSSQIEQLRVECRLQSSKLKKAEIRVEVLELERNVLAEELREVTRTWEEASAVQRRIKSAGDEVKKLQMAAEDQSKTASDLESKFDEMAVCLQSKKETWKVMQLTQELQILKTAFDELTAQRVELEEQWSSHLADDDRQRDETDAMKNSLAKELSRTQESVWTLRARLGISQSTGSGDTELQQLREALGCFQGEIVPKVQELLATCFDTRNQLDLLRTGKQTNQVTDPRVARYGFYVFVFLLSVCGVVDGGRLSLTNGFRAVFWCLFARGVEKLAQGTATGQASLGW